MITTTVIWPQDGGIENPTEEQRTALSNMALTLSPDFNGSLVSAADPTGAIIATRTWPTHEIAQAWVDYVLANFNVSSAVINPE
jgi:hypothetical protein